MEETCIRCKTKVSVMDVHELRGLGWHWIRGGSIYGEICPHCYHELKRFLAEEEIKKLVS